MNDTKGLDHKPDQHSQTTKRADSASPLHWLREGMAGIISLVILTTAAAMLYGTYNYVRETPANADATVSSARKESYERQKDIMLYALALLGTVTGYYLGRAPAELHAQQAQKSANTAQDQLQKTQKQLSETSGSAAVAAAQVTVAEKDKNTAKAKLSRATNSLEVAKSVISKALSQPTATKVLGASAGGDLQENVEEWRRAEMEIESALREIRD